MNRTGELELRRISGALLSTSLLVGVVAAVVMIASGALSAFFYFLGGSLGGLAPYLPAFRFSTYLWAAAWMVVLLGFTALTRLLVRHGDDRFAILALAATVVATVLAMLEATFTIGVTTWAVEEAASTGTTPQIYTALDDGLFDSIQFVYTVLGFAAQAGFGAALLKTGLLPSWLGMTVLVWGVAWLVLDSYVGIPALLLIMPAVIGLSLLKTSRTAAAAPTQ